MRLARLGYRRFLGVSGRDAEQFLQSLTTQDIRALNQSATAALPSLFLNSQGHVQFETLISKPPSSVTESRFEYLIDHSAACTDALLRKLQKHRLRSDVVFEDVTSSLHGLQLMPQASPSLPGATPDVTHSTPNTLLSIFSNRASGYAAYADPRSHRPGRLGYRIIANWSAVDSLMQDLSQCDVQNTASADQFEQHRFVNGVLENHDAMPTAHNATDEQKHPQFRCLPTQLNYDWLGYLCSQKGCYVGQEIVARLLLAPVMRKRLVVLRLASALQPEAAYQVQIFKGALADHKQETPIFESPVVARCSPYVAAVLSSRACSKSQLGNERDEFFDQKPSLLQNGSIKDIPTYVEFQRWLSLCRITVSCRERSDDSISATVVMVDY